MKSALFIAAAGSAVFVAAQNLTGEPDCAIPCLSSAIAAVCTPASDRACSCASQSAIAQGAVSCLLANCSANDLSQAQTAGAQLCIDYSATASGAASTSVGTANSTALITTSTTTTGSSAASTASASGGGAVTGSTATGSTATGSSAATAASATSSAGAYSVDGVVAAQAGLLGAILAGVAALL